MALAVNDFSRSVKFWIFEGYAVIPLLIWAPRPKLGTFMLFIVMILLFTIMARRGMRGAMIVRRLRRLAIGNRRYIRPPYRVRE